MTEFEQCLLLTLKDIKSQLNDISGGLQYIGNELGKINEREDEMTDPGMVAYEIKELNKTLKLVKEIAIERL